MDLVPVIVMLYSAVALVLIVVLLSKKGMAEDNNLKRMKSIGKDVVRAEYKNVDTSFYERMIKPIIDKMNNVDESGKKQSKNARQRQQTLELAKKLRQAGLHISPSNFNFIKIAFTIVISILFVGLGLVLMSYTEYFYFVIIIGIMLGALGPNLFLNSRVKKHQGEIRTQLPDVLDLMSVCMEAGLSFDASLVKISERMEGPLIDELVTVFKQIQLGKSRSDALKTLSDSTTVEELKTFVSAVIQANQLGIPITNVLKAQSEQLRVAKREEIRTVAAKVPTKMTIPTVFLILPAIILVIMGPIILQVLDTFKDIQIF